MIITLKPPPCDGPDHAVGNQHDVQYRRWVASMSVHLTDNYGAGPLFTTNVGPYLWEWYINASWGGMLYRGITSYGMLLPQPPRTTASKMLGLL